MTTPKDNTKLGYDNKLEISFISVLYSTKFKEKISEDSILSKMMKGNGVVLIAKDIVKINTGVRIPFIDSTMLIKSEKLTNALQILIGNWKKYHIKYHLDKKCSPHTEVNIYPWKYLTNDKCIYERKYLLDVVSAAPAIPGSNSASEKTEFADNNPITEKSPFMKALQWAQVYRFFHSIIQTIPLELFGSSYNRKCFKKATKQLLMMGRYDLLSLEVLMLGVKISHCRWTADLNSFAVKSKVVAQVWIWLFKTFVLDILKIFFYVTEGNQWKNQLFFFRKRNFQGLHDAACDKMLKDQTFCKLSNSQTEFLNKKPASLRFIPKRSGMRAILPIKGSILTRNELLNAKRLINYITSKFYKGIQNVRSISNFQKTWVKFWNNIGHSKDQPVFIVKVDISDAFGSIKQDLLIKLLTDAENTLPRFVKFGRFMSQTNSRISYFQIPLGDDNQILDTSREFHQPLIKAGNTFHISVKDTLKNVKMLVNGQVIKIGSNERYLITKGIAQGASLSSGLCDLYYSAMCKKYLMSFKGNGRVLMRSVDDFIYVTPCKIQAKKFLDLMENGIEEFNCYVNSGKTVHNLNGYHHRIFFRGTLFCTQSKQLLIPVSSLSSIPPRYSIRLNKFSNPGKFIILKLGQIIKARFAPLVYHPSYVTISAFVSNIWRAGIMVGGRLSCLIKVLILPTKQFNPNFFSKSILGLVKKIWPKISSLWKSVGRSLTISRQFFMSVFMGGIYVMLGVPGHPPLKSLRDHLRRKITKYLREISFEEKELLPRPSAKIFKLGS